MKSPSSDPADRLPSQWLRILVVLALLMSLAAVEAIARPVQSAQEDQAASETQSPQAPERVEVDGVTSDRAIDKRLTDIMESTGWFEDVELEVRDGVVFLDGRTRSEEYRDWAAELAGNTQDVVAVVNRIGVIERSLWDFSPAINEMQILWQRTVRKLPMFAIALLILILSVISAKLVAVGARRILGPRMKPLLRDVAARAISIPIFILGFYLVLRVAGLTRLATTVLGGTGLVGLVAGIAFRDILENFLASILISMRNPFKLGDLVETTGHLGVVQRVTSRGTVLMDVDGNHVQIPNATIYKSIIRNYTANPNRRDSFVVGIGYENEAAAAQETALAVLSAHPAVLEDPEPLVLVDQLGAATVNLKVYFWYDGSMHNGLKVKSSLIRLVKRAFEEQGISMPDEAREVVFPDGVPVRMLEAAAAEPAEALPARPLPEISEPEAVATAAEGNLASEEDQLKEQARRARAPDEGADLLNAEAGSK